MSARKNVNPDQESVQDQEVEQIDLHKYVPIKLFKDNGRYKEPLPVAVNDYSALIPRGSVQYVPLFVKMHIEEMQEQDENTARLIEGIVEEAETKFKTAGI